MASQVFLNEWGRLSCQTKCLLKPGYSGAPLIWTLFGPSACGWIFEVTLFRGYCYHVGGA